MSVLQAGQSWSDAFTDANGTFHSETVSVLNVGPGAVDVSGNGDGIASIAPDSGTDFSVLVDGSADWSGDAGTVMVQATGNVDASTDGALTVNAAGGIGNLMGGSIIAMAQYGIGSVTATGSAVNIVADGAIGSISAGGDISYVSAGGGIGSLNAGGSIEVDWPLERALKAGDAGIGVPVLSELYDRMKATPVETDLPALWKQLGVKTNGDAVTFDDSAALAPIRRAITMKPH